MSAPQPNTIVDQPATPAACQADHQAAAARREDEQGLHYSNQLGALGTGQQHTHRG
ncbi:hypothetical protein GT352_28090 [Streptomyces sp. SID1046]|uniref:hypothetical protein n=1 Tax=Streptomyces sp. SID1046 TaxID=2690249 RepID=UPI001370E906|nr:hypothetical protein [Streptomyces sp. SID1046]MYV77762.1 hypothetical protein [Streptomyces sp. SID1046]